MPAPFFSIIIPTYNRGKLISGTIRSVVNQSFRDWELIIIDDGSKDNTGAVVSGFKDERIKYFWQENTERSRARNNGIAKATGEFICFLDSDDHWRPQHLAVLFENIKEQQETPGIYFTGITWIFPDRRQDVLFPSPLGQNAVEYLITNQVAPSAVCIHRDILQQHQFNPSMRINEDVELFARIAASYLLIQIPEITVDFFIHDQNTKSLEKNYITPQIEAMKIIFSDPALQGKISPDFKTNRLRGLRHTLINYYQDTGQYGPMRKEILRFLVLYPFHEHNKSKIVLLLYHLPGGNLLQKLVGKLKR